MTNLEVRKINENILKLIEKYGQVTEQIVRDNDYEQDTCIKVKNSYCEALIEVYAELGIRSRVSSWVRIAHVKPVNFTKRLTGVNRRYNRRDGRSFAGEINEIKCYYDNVEKWLKVVFNDFENMSKLDKNSADYKLMSEVSGYVAHKLITNNLYIVERDLQNTIYTIYKVNKHSTKLNNYQLFFTI